MAVHVVRGDGLTGAHPANLARHRTLIESIGGTFHQVVGNDISNALLSFARGVNATQLVLGETSSHRQPQGQPSRAGSGCKPPAAGGHGHLSIAGAPAKRALPMTNMPPQSIRNNLPDGSDVRCARISGVLSTRPSLIANWAAVIDPDRTLTRS